MKLGFAAYALLSTASAFSLDIFAFNGLSSAPTKPEIEATIPGNSPIETCLDDEPQLLDLEFVDIYPNPPVPGENLTITAKGTLKEDLVEGSYVDVLVRYGFITLVNRRYDLCELLPEVDLECPLKAGLMYLTRTVEVPEEAPPGTYVVQAKAFTPEEDLVTCLTATVAIEA